MSFLAALSAEAAAQRQLLRQQILTVEPDGFESLALDVFRYQATHNPLYRTYLHHLNSCPEQITDLHRVPFMPIGFFKNHTILSGFEVSGRVLTPSLTFVSSGTSSGGAGSADRPSHHLVPDSALYDAVSTRIFERTYGSLQSFHILALLPSYLERNNSSLVYMVQRFMEQANSDKSGFFLDNHDELTRRLRTLTERPNDAETNGPAKRILLIGVTFGLLDWAESGVDLSFLSRIPDLVVMETGGMKGRRNELLREEVHQILMDRLGVEAIHSEYGMTELLSQAYSTGGGVFRPGPTMRVLLRDVNDPFLVYPNDYAQTGERRTGGINVVDLANLDSCAFIETSDLGQYVRTDDDSDERLFRVIGRFDNSDVRGCNLMVV